MNEADDPLEAELAALRPQAISPGLRQRVAERLAESPSRRARWLWGLALAGGLAAACVAAVLVFGRGNGRGVPPAPPGPLVEGSSAPRDTGDDSLPTVQAYQRALARSPEELDALLDRHAARLAPPNPQGAQVYAFPRPTLETRTWIGEP
jgi:hypothetical protein